MTLVLMLAACGGNDTPTGGGQTQAQDSGNQAAPPGGVAPPVPAAAEEGRMEINIPFLASVSSEGPQLEVTILPGYSVVESELDPLTAPIVRLENGEKVNDSVAQFVMIPVRLTNISPPDTAGRGGGLNSLVILSPYFMQQEGREPGDLRGAGLTDFRLGILGGHSLMRRFGEEMREPFSIQPGETVETYIIFPFVGDGEYILYYANDGIISMTIDIRQ